MKRIFWVLLIVLCLSGQSAHADEMWSCEDPGLKVYVTAPTYTDIREAEQYTKWRKWQSTDIKEADFIFVLLRSTEVDPLEYNYDGLNDLLEDDLDREDALYGCNYHAYLYKINKKDRKLKQYFHAYTNAEGFTIHNNNSIKSP